MFFFPRITAMVEKKKAKPGRRRNDSESSEDDEEEVLTIIVAFLSELCLIDLNMTIRHLKNIYPENF